MTLFTKPKTLILDIETMMGKAHLWRMYEEVSNLSMLIEPVTILCWAAKWADEDYTYFDSVHRNSREGMLENLWHLLDEADVVVGWNSNRFDLRHINAEFFLMGMGPPSPYKKLDLQKSLAKNMKFMSNKLDYVADAQGIGRKLEHGGLDLWFKCQSGDKKAWQTMEEYNIHDVELTEEVYFRSLPWLPQTVNRSILEGHVCPECGSTNLQSRGHRYTATRVYDRWFCKDCGSWHQSVSSRKGVAATLKKEAI